MLSRFENFDAARRAVAGYLGRPLHVEDVPAPRDVDPESLAAGPDGVDTLLVALLATLRAKEQEAAMHRRRAAAVSAQVLRDALTGLGNRSAWDRAIAREERRCRRYGGHAAVVIVDLDDMKPTNDEWGHSAGDELLCRAARALSQAAREPDLVARLGGDEFAVLAVNCDPQALATLEQRLRDALAEAGVQASLGAAIRTNATGLAGAVCLADRRMYRDKRRRKRHKRSDPLGNGTSSASSATTP